MPAIDVKEELRLCQQFEAERAPMDSWWQSIKEVVTPRDAYITRQSSATPIQDYDRIHDTTVIESAEGLANMMTAQLTPAGQQWLVWVPPCEFEDDDEVVEWYAQCSMRAMKLVNQSMFAVRQADVNIERSTVGTGTMLCYETGDRSKPFRFKHVPVGEYTFQEDLDGVADEIRRKFEATAAQLAKEFPNAPFGPKVANALSDPRKKHTDKFKVWHVVRPREGTLPGQMENTNLPYAEFYICEEDQNLLEETGQHEFPAMVSRFQSGADGSKWGVSPARKAMPAIAQANFLQEQLDVLLDVQINPRILAEAGMVGEIDMRPGQKTLVRAGALANSQGGVREWLTGGNYPLGKDRIQDKQNQIRKLFYHGLWADLARVEKEMTAEEVRAIRDQSELLFVGVNARFESDMRPMLSRRIFGICLRAGIFPPPPRQILKEVGDEYSIPDPQSTFQTNLSRVLLRKMVENSDMLLMRIQHIAQYQPDVVDELDLSIHVRELARAFGFKGPFLRAEEDVLAIQQAKLRAQQEQHQQEQALAAADAASKMSPNIQDQMMQQAM